GSLLRGRRRVAPASLLPCCAADCLDQDGSPFPSPQLFQYRRRVMHRSDRKRAFLVQQQISELGPEDAHRVFQQRLKYRLQFTGRRSDDLENLSAREQLLQGLPALIYSSSISPLISCEKAIPPSVTVALAGNFSLPLSRPSAKAWRTAFSISPWALTPSPLRDLRMLPLNTSSFMIPSLAPRRSRPRRQDKSWSCQGTAVTRIMHPFLVGDAGGRPGSAAKSWSTASVQKQKLSMVNR